MADSGRWITIGGTKGDDGKRHGGSPVYIERGRITRGAPGLVGKKIDALQEDAAEYSHRKELQQSRSYARARAAKEAKGQGIDPTHLHQLAAELLAHDKAAVGDKTVMLREARKALSEWGGKHRAITIGHLTREDVPHLDEVAETMVRKYPYAFDERTGDSSDQLLDMLTQGNPQPMTEEDAYTEALDHLMQHRVQDEDAEQVPEPGSDIFGDPPPPSERVQGRLYGFGSKLEGKVSYGTSRKADPVYVPNRGDDAVPFSLSEDDEQQRLGRPFGSEPHVHQLFPGVLPPGELERIVLECRGEGPPEHGQGGGIGESAGDYAGLHRQRSLPRRPGSTSRRKGKRR